MKSSINDKVEGSFHTAKGKVKGKIGNLTDNPRLEADGKVEEISGKMQEKIGKIKEVLGE